MRISSSLFFQTGLNSINAQQSDLMHLFQQIGSGQRMVTPADDPLAAAQAVNISQAQTVNARYADNREIARQNLGAEENTLNSVTLLMQDIKTRLIEAGNGTLSDADRMTLANVLKDARTTMLGLANATDGNGQYLFSGSLGDVMPFDEVTGSYKGDASQRDIQVDQTRRMSGSDVGADVFLRATPGVVRYFTDAPTDGNGDPTNTGTGVIGAATIYDASQLKPGFEFKLQFTTPADNTYTIEVYDRNNPNYPNPPSKVDPAAYLPLPDWEAAQTFEPGKDNIIELPFGVQIKLSGNPDGGDVFNVSPAASQELNMFNSIDDIVRALERPFEADPSAQAHFLNALASSMQRLDVNYDNILTVRASVGARFNELDALEANGGLRDLGYRDQLSKLEDLDYYTASTQLELRKSALEAASLAFRKIQGTSLFNMGQG